MARNGAGSRRSEGAAPRLAGRALTIVIAALLATGSAFRLLRLSSVPGVSGDEGWWGIQAVAWLAGRPYETHTTSGNPIDMFFLLPIALAHAIASPSIPLLRAVPVAANLLALPVGFWFVHRLHGSTTAWIHTVALAVLPTAIAHSRICQDPSQSVLWTGIIVYLSLLGLHERRRAWIHASGALVVFLVALWTHPTNIFVAPFLLLPIFGAVRPLVPATSGRTLVVRAAAIFVALMAIALSIAMLMVGYLAGLDDYLDARWLAIAAERMTDGGQWFEFAANNARLFSGVTVYHYFSGARPPTLPYDAAFVIVTGALVAGFLLGLAAGRSPLDYGLLFANASVWLAFYAVAGPHALRPHFERWGLCLIVPATLVLARGLTAWIERTPRIKWISIAAATLVATSLLGSFYINYFREFATSGGRSHLTYVTAAVEPKQQALAHVLARSPGPGPVAIVAQQWWLALPLAYLATEHGKVSVSATLAAEQPGFRDALEDGRVFLVEFVGTRESAAADGWIQQRGLRATRTTVRDASGSDLIEILQVAPAR